MDSVKFSQLVEHAIKERGIKRTFIAQQLGITRQALSKKMTGGGHWSLDQAMRVCKILNIPPEAWLK